MVGSNKCEGAAALSCSSTICQLLTNLTCQFLKTAERFKSKLPIPQNQGLNNTPQIAHHSLLYSIDWQLGSALLFKTGSLPGALLINCDVNLPILISLTNWEYYIKTALYQSSQCDVTNPRRFSIESPAR